MRYPILLSLASALVLNACYIEVEEDDEPYYAPPGSFGADIAESSIDADFGLEDINPGQDVGVYVEYLSGGTWRIFATCDTLLSGYECNWEIATTVRGGDFLPPPDADSLESNDLVNWDSVGAWVDTITVDGIDGFYIETSPGASVEVEAYLDGDPANQYIFWVRDGAVEPGSPTNPIKLTPDTP